MWRRVRNGPDLGSGRYEWLNLKTFFFLAASPHSFMWVYEYIYCSTDLDWGEYACHTSTATLHPQFCNKKSCGLSWLLRVYVGIHHLGFREPSPVLQEPWAVEIVSWVHLYSNIELESRSWQPHYSYTQRQWSSRREFYHRALCWIQLNYLNHTNITQEISKWFGYSITNFRGPQMSFQLDQFNVLPPPPWHRKTTVLSSPRQEIS